MRTKGIRDLLRVAWVLTDPEKLKIDVEDIKDKISVALEQNQLSFRNITDVTIIGTSISIQTKPLGIQIQKDPISIDFINKKSAEFAKSHIMVAVEDSEFCIGSVPPAKPEGREFKAWC